MLVSDLNPDDIASILHGNWLLHAHRDQHWFVAMHGQVEIQEQPTGDYVGERLHIHMRPRQDSIIPADKFESSSAAFSSTTPTGANPCKPKRHKSSIWAALVSTASRALRSEITTKASQES